MFYLSTLSVCVAVLSDCMLISELLALKGRRRKWSLANWRCYGDICRQGLTKQRKTSDQQISGPRFEPGIRCRLLAASICKAERRNMTWLTIVFLFFLLSVCQSVETWLDYQLFFIVSSFCVVECRNVNGLTVVFHFSFFLYGRV